MSKYKLMIAALALTTLASAKNLENQPPQIRMQELKQLYLGGTNQILKLQNVQMDISNLDLKVPSQYTNDDRERILSLLSELKQTCPTCSTGVTIGSGTIVGGNTGGTDTPLFPIGGGNKGGLIPTVTITKFEYDELIKKAALYDSIITESGGQQ
ncbi:hypothetical protein [Aeromonas caviae]|uniref:hypothetical protein n=1 Tax=Aeromonas caviae TaxID=648 RepID=UPI002B49EEF8|nr:hypothetical protein [Aeromonas caviae]